MPVHQAAGEKIEVTPRSLNLYFYRRMGVRIEVSPKRSPWCLWLCSTTKSVDEIAGEATLQGLAQPAIRTGSCSDCGSLNVMSKRFFGIGVPKPYDSATYSIRVTMAGQGFSFAGSVIFD